MTDMEKDREAKNAVRETYGKFIRKDSSDIVSDESEIQEYSHQLGYSKEELKDIPQGADMGLGCGNPIAAADLQPGDVVLDLGSGGGFDCFLAVKRVGPKGFVIGVDMMPAMIDKSRSNAQNAKTGNIEFRLGEIEALPVANSIIDVVISNCVINLSTDKPRVFREIFRVLKRGGKMCVSDIVAIAPLSDSVKSDLAKCAGCVAGIMSLDEYRSLLTNCGFVSIKIRVTPPSRCFIEKWTSSSGAENYIASGLIEAMTPSVNAI